MSYNVGLSNLLYAARARQPARVEKRLAVELMHAEQYELAILDTATAGHTIRLLALPEQMEH